MNKNREIFETMPVPKALATLAVPTIISQLITMIYNMADTIFIGMTDDPNKIAASSVTFVLVFAMSAIANLFGAGGGSLISRLMGEKKDKEAASVSSFSFWSALMASALYGVLLLIFMEPVLTFLGITENTMPYAKDYALFVVVIGVIPANLSMTMANLLRSEGYATHASAGLAAGGIFNIILDPIFMFVVLEPGMEVKGAAIATLLSNCAVFIYFIVIYFVIRKKSVISLSPKKFMLKKHYVKQVFAIGFPAALGSLLACLSNMTINKLVSGYGEVPLAAVGIVKKIDMLPMNVGMGLCQGMVPLVAYNYASGDYKRMKQFSSAARAVGMGFAVFCIIVFQCFAKGIVNIFIGDAATVEYGIDFLRICCLAVPLMIFNFQMSFTFQAMGMGKQSLLLSSMRQGLVNIPLLFIMNHFFGLYGAVWTQLIADSITGGISYYVYHRSYEGLLKKREMHLEEASAETEQEEFISKGTTEAPLDAEEAISDSTIEIPSEVEETVDGFAELETETMDV